MPNDAIDTWIMSEWRELGFYCEHDDKAKERRMIGSRAGLLRFRDILVDYAANQRNDAQSEHEHYGPYFLEIMTWPTAGMDNHAIFGSLADLRRLAAIIEDKVRSGKPGDTICINGEYSKNPDFSLVLVVREDEFDPASADPSLFH